MMTEAPMMANRMLGIGKRLFTSLVSGVAVVALTGCSARSIDWANAGARPGEGFQVKQLQHEGRARNYTVFVPHDYNPRARYPVIVFLHGVLEAGSDGRKCVTVGLGPAVSTREATFPFIVVFPQSTSDWRSDSNVALAMATLDAVLKDYPAADRDRVCLTGLSNGGDGTWSIGARYASRFAGLVPMCSGPNLDDAARLTHTPIWAIHNQVDPFRSSGKVKAMCERIRQLGGDAKYTEYPTFGHDCWTRALSDEQVFDWMKAQRRGSLVSVSTIR
jgi:predicted peptidase